MNKNVLVPSGISALRLVALPLFLCFFANGATAGCIVVFGLAQLTDLLDGYFARKLGVASKFGAYFDAATDFVLVTGIFIAFTLSNYYPAWILLLIAASFTQFIITSRFHKKLYDPLGKYIGSVLYIAIGLTLLAPTTPVFVLVEVGFSGFAITSFVTRTVSLTTDHRKNLLIQRGLQQAKPHTA
jgi:phosphatidylglycerophosphate synthase